MVCASPNRTRKVAHFCRLVFAAAQRERQLLNTLTFSVSSTHCRRYSSRLEIVMTPKKQRPASKAVLGISSPPLQPKTQTAPAEPAEVLGGHKNSGQKGHKDAR